MQSERAQIGTTRERIVAEAMRLFWEKGYGSTSIQDILRAAGANSGSLYHFFPAKQDLLLAVLDGYIEGLQPVLLEPAWRGLNDPIDRVFALLAKYRELLVETDCFYGCPLGSLALELHEPDPVVRPAPPGSASWNSVGSSSGGPAQMARPGENHPCGRHRMPTGPESVRGPR